MAKKVQTIGVHPLDLAEDLTWTHPASVAVLLHPVYTFNGIDVENVIELKGLEDDYTPGDDPDDFHNERVETMTAADARALAALLLKAADAAEAKSST